MLELPDAAKQYKESFEAWNTLAHEAGGDPLVAESVQDNIDTLLIIMEALEPQAAEQLAEVVVHQPQEDTAAELRRKRIHGLRETEPFKRGTITEDRVQEMLSALPEPAERYTDEDKLFATGFFVSRVLSRGTMPLDIILLVADAKSNGLDEGGGTDDSAADELSTGESIQEEAGSVEPEFAPGPVLEKEDEGPETDTAPDPSAGEEIPSASEETDTEAKPEGDEAGAESVDNPANKERTLKVNHMMAKYIQARNGLLEHFGLPILECDEYADITKAAVLPNPLDHHGEFESIFAEVGPRVEAFMADPSGFTNEWFETYTQEDPGWGLLEYLIKTVVDDDTGAAFRKAMTAEVVSAYEEPKGKPKDRDVTRVVFDIDGEEVTIESNGHAAVEHSLRRYLAQYDAESRELIWTADEQAVREKPAKLHGGEERHLIEQALKGPMRSTLRYLTGAVGAITKANAKLPVGTAAAYLMKPNLLDTLQQYQSRGFTLSDSSLVDLATILTAVAIEDCETLVDGVNLGHRKNRRVVIGMARKLVEEEVRAYERHLAATGVTVNDPTE